MAWANGRGTTTEIARHPPGDGAFDWRISCAEVVEDGPFSRLPGIDRILVVLEGRGIRLEHGEHAAVLGALRPYAFSGDDETFAHLVDGPIRDLGVMTRRGAASARLVVVRDEPIDLDAGPGEALAHCVRGRARLVASEIAEIGAGETAWIAAPASVIAIVPESPDATVVVVGLGPG